METILKFDKFVLAKELNEKFKKVGDVFEIANITENSFLLRDARSKVAIGVISFEDLEKCFIPEENFKGWTKWTSLVGVDGQTDALYRTNRKKVQVKFLTDKVRAESACHKADEFSLSFGLQIAYMRGRNKALLKQKAMCEEKLKEANTEIADNERIIKKMVRSLEA